MNHARILSAYLGRLKLRDLRNILHSAEACSFAQMNYGTRAQVEEQRQFDETVEEAVSNLFDHDVALIDAAVRRESLSPPSRDAIRQVFLARGFTIKEGQTDLKPYVYEAAEALFGKEERTDGHT